MSDFVVGLTGGIGSGKSAAAECFAAHGIAVIDTDAIARELTAPGGVALAQLVAAFGDHVLTADGAMDRARVRALVFADPEARKRLEAILHPLIRQVSGDRCRLAASPYVVLAVPLLVESGTYRERCDRIVAVDCPESLQISRVMARSGLPEDEVRAIMMTQATRGERLAAADDVLVNDADLAGLAAQVACLHCKFLALAARKGKSDG